MKFDDINGIKASESKIYVTDPEVKKQIEKLTASLTELITQFVELKENVDEFNEVFITEALTATIASIGQITGTTAFYDVFNGKKFAFSSGGESSARITIKEGTVIYAELDDDYIFALWGNGELFFCVANNDQKWNIMEDGDLMHSSGNAFNYWTIGGGASETTGTAVIARKLLSGVTAQGNFNATFADLQIVNSLNVNGQTTLNKLTVTDTITGTAQNAVNASNDADGNSIIGTYETIADTDTIKALIPTQASADNQLADKEFVNSSISSNTATFFGSFSTYALFEASWGTGETKNDYAIVLNDETHDGQTSRYKYTGVAWVYEYKVNDTPFTAEQNAAINSGITQQLVAKVEGIETNAQKNVQADWTNEDSTSDAYIKNKPGLATEETAGLMSASDKQIVDQMSAGGVTGVKGNNESSYRTGQVNIQLSDITGIDTQPTEGSDNLVKSGPIWDMFNAIWPVGVLYTQLPGCQSPSEIGMLGTWERFYTGGCFLRGEGGDAKAFTDPVTVTAVSGTSLTLADVSNITAGDLLINGDEYRTVSAISGNVVTVDSAFTSSEITTVLIAQSESLPNITGTVYAGYAYSVGMSGSGCFTNNTNDTIGQPSGGTYTIANSTVNVKLDASRSSSAYKTGGKVNPNCLTVRYWKRTA